MPNIRLLLLLSLLVACGTKTGTTDTNPTPTDDTGCDTPPPVVCALGESLESDPMGFETLDILDGDGVTVETLACADLPCCADTLAVGSYTFVATLGEEQLQQQATVEDAAATSCDRETIWLTFTFDVAR